MLQIGISIPVVFFGGLLLRIRFGELRRVLTRLTAITVFCGALALWLPVGGYVATVAFMALLIWLCHTEVYEAVGLALLYFGVRFVVSVAVFVATFSG